MLALQVRLQYLANTTNEWLSVQRNLAQDTILDLNQRALSSIGNSILLINDFRQNTSNHLETQCSDAQHRNQLSQHLFGNATTAGQSISACAQTAHVQLSSIVTDRLNTNFWIAETSAAALKSNLLFGWILYTPQHKEGIAEFMGDYVDLVELSFRTIMFPFVEGQLTFVAEEGLLYVDQAIACAYDAADAFARVSSSIAEEC